MIKNVFVSDSERKYLCGDSPVQFINKETKNIRKSKKDECQLKVNHESKH